MLLHFYLIYHSVFPDPSLPPVMVVEGESEGACACCLSYTSFCHLASLSALSLAICCCTTSLWARSFSFALIHNILCLSLLSVHFDSTKFLSLVFYQILSSWLPKMQRILFIISSLVKIINLYFTESKWQSRVSGL